MRGGGGRRKERERGRESGGWGVMSRALERAQWYSAGWPRIRMNEEVGLIINLTGHLLGWAGTQCR